MQAIINEFLRKKSMCFSENTLNTYRYVLNDFADSILVNKTEIDKKDIKAYTRLLVSRGNKAKTIHLKLAAIQSLLNWGLENKIWDKIPTIDKRTIRSSQDDVPPSINSYELYLLKQATKDNLRDRCIIELLYCSGVRVSELVSIKFADIKWDLNEIWITVGKRAKERHVMFTKQCREWLLKYISSRQDSSEYVIVTRYGKHITRQGVWKRLKGYNQQISIDPRISPHSFRRAFTTTMFNKEVPPEITSLLLGHVRIGTTITYKRDSNEKMLSDYLRYYKR